MLFRHRQIWAPDEDRTQVRPILGFRLPNDMSGQDIIHSGDFLFHLFYFALSSSWERIEHKIYKVGISALRLLPKELIISGDQLLGGTLPFWCFPIPRLHFSSRNAFCSSNLQVFKIVQLVLFGGTSIEFILTSSMLKGIDCSDLIAQKHTFQYLSKSIKCAFEKAR